MKKMLKTIRKISRYLIENPVVIKQGKIFQMPGIFDLMSLFSDPNRRFIMRKVRDIFYASGHEGTHGAISLVTGRGERKNWPNALAEVSNECPLGDGPISAQ